MTRIAGIAGQAMRFVARGLVPSAFVLVAAFTMRAQQVENPTGLSGNQDQKEVSTTSPATAPAEIAGSSEATRLNVDTESSSVSQTEPGGETQQPVPQFAAQSAPESPSTAAPQTIPNDAQRSPFPPPEHAVLRNFVHDEYRMWTAPFRVHDYNPRTMLFYGLPFVATSGVLIATDRHTASQLDSTSGSVVWSGRVSQIGAPYTLAAISAATYLIGRAAGNQHARETGFLALEALAHSQLITIVFKEITNRERPATSPSGTGFWQGGNSFPSGHAAGSFAVATVFAREYGDHIIVPIAAYSLATLVAVSRASARQHWVSDIFVGGALGFLVGRYVYKTHHNPELSGSVKPVSRLRPEFEIGANGPGLYWNF